MATGGGSDNNDRPRTWRKREHEQLFEDGSERSLRPRSTKAPRRRTSEPSVYVYESVLSCLGPVGWSDQY